MQPIRINLSLIFIAATTCIGPRITPTVTAAKPSILQRPSLASVAKKGLSTKKRKDDDADAYLLLARSIRSRLNSPPDGGGGEGGPVGATTDHDVHAISSALRSLSKTQSALKKIDGTAHEVYQRTHRSSTSLDDSDDDEGDDEGRNDEVSGGSSRKIGGLKVAGRMSRNAARVGCIADALFAAELCELILLAPPSTDATTTVAGGDAVEGEEGGEVSDGILYDEEGTLAPWTGRRVVLNTTVSSDRSDDLRVNVLVIHEPDYDGGAGVGHGGVDDLLSFAREEMEEGDDGADSRSDALKPRGRYLVILSDDCSSGETTRSESGPSSRGDLTSIISVLDTPPRRVRTSSRGGGGDVACVCGPLYDMAGDVLEAVGPVVLKDDGKGPKDTSDEDNSDSEDRGERTDAVAASAVDSLSLPAIHFVGYSLAGGIAALAANILHGSLPRPLGDDGTPRRASSGGSSGAARDRASAFCVGPPPCLSRNLPTPFVKSVINGDDVVCRTTRKAIDRLCDRARRSIRGGVLGRSVGWVSEAVSLTMSGMKGDDDGEGGGGRLTVPGNVFLVRPRKLGGGSSSIHEAGGGDGGREALRAAVLWQLNDVLLSGSLWAHHGLDAYIRSLDRVRLKGFADSPSDESYER